MSLNDIAIVAALPWGNVSRGSAAPDAELSGLKVALINDWLTGTRRGEKVLGTEGGTSGPLRRLANPGPKLASIVTNESTNTCNDICEEPS